MYGFLHQTNDKATIVREIRKLYHDDLEDMLGDDRRQRKVMIIDGMAIVNRINLSKIKNCQEFAESFINIVLHEATGCDEIRVVFDCHIEDSLNAQTRSKRTGNLLVHYRVLEETQISHLDTKQFLSSINNNNNNKIFYSPEFSFNIYKTKTILQSTVSSNHIIYCRFHRKDIFFVEHWKGVTYTGKPGLEMSTLSIIISSVSVSLNLLKAETDRRKKRQTS